LIISARIARIASHRIARLGSHRSARLASLGSHRSHRIAPLGSARIARLASFGSHHIALLGSARIARLGSHRSARIAPLGSHRIAFRPVLFHLNADALQRMHTRTAPAVLMASASNGVAGEPTLASLTPRRRWRPPARCARAAGTRVLRAPTPL